MNLIAIVTNAWNAAAGWRTHLASLAAILSALAGLVGVLPATAAQELAIAFGGLAAIALRLSQTQHALTLDESLKALQEARDLLARKPGEVTVMDMRLLDEAIAEPEPPATIPFPGSPFPAGRTGLLILLAASIVIAGAAGSHAEDRPDTRPQHLTSMQLSAETRGWYRNPDGSCVQCSIGMAGCHCNDINAASLLWDTDYGPAIRGGSWPSRVEQYCDARGIKAWSVTGATIDETMPWIEWAARTGRFAAIGAGRAHFQTLYGYDPSSPRPWMVCNNNSPGRIDRYDDREFRALHAASGPWVVILQRPSSDPPAFSRWWK